jgi:hypothetical protein
MSCGPPRTPEQRRLGRGHVPFTFLSTWEAVLRACSFSSWVLRSIGPSAISFPKQSCRWVFSTDLWYETRILSCGVSHNPWGSHQTPLVLVVSLLGVWTRIMGRKGPGGLVPLTSEGAISCLKLKVANGIDLSYHSGFGLGCSFSCRLYQHIKQIKFLFSRTLHSSGVTEPQRWAQSIGRDYMIAGSMVHRKSRQGKRISVLG